MSNSDFTSWAIGIDRHRRGLKPIRRRTYSAEERADKKKEYLQKYRGLSKAELVEWIALTNAELEEIEQFEESTDAKELEKIRETHKKFGWGFWRRDTKNNRVELFKPPDWLDPSDSELDDLKRQRNVIIKKWGFPKQGVLEEWEWLRYHGSGGKNHIYIVWADVRHTSLRIKLATLRELKAKKTRQEKDAAAAAYKGEIRAGSSSQKRNIGVTKDCPYCGQPLGRDYEADHIYPVSKGGLSTSENMVNICRMCNRKKHDLTLRQFCKKNGFNRAEIERNLEALGKDF